MLRIGLAQLNSRQNKAANLEAAARAVECLAGLGADLVLLPEMFNFHGLDRANAEAAEPIPGPSTMWASEKARQLGVYLHCGSLAELRDGQVYNTSVVYDRSGLEVARYSKLHLWDARTPDGLEYRESDWFAPGDSIAVFHCEGIKAGLAICYDLRFPELFRALADQGVELFLIPAAFTVPTGISHWEPLLRARAIENGCYVAACGQWGPYARGRQNYGHSMVVDPWGVVIAQCGEGVGVITADLDPAYVSAVRRQMPVLRHRRRDLFG